MLSFGDPRPFAEKIRQSGAKLLCQVQSLAIARQALAAQPDVLVAQGTEAGGMAASARCSPCFQQLETWQSIDQSWPPAASPTGAAMTPPWRSARRRAGRHALQRRQ